MSGQDFDGTWSRDKQTGDWQVLARLDAARTGRVRVAKKNGDVEYVRVTPPDAAELGFDARFGPLQGQTVVFCAVAGAETAAATTPATAALTAVQQQAIQRAWESGVLSLQGTWDGAPLDLIGLQDLLAGRSAEGAVEMRTADGGWHPLQPADLPGLAETCQAHMQAAATAAHHADDSVPF